MLSMVGAQAPSTTTVSKPRAGKINAPPASGSKKEYRSTPPTEPMDCKSEWPLINTNYNCYNCYVFGHNEDRYGAIHNMGVLNPTNCISDLHPLPTMLLYQKYHMLRLHLLAPTPMMISL